MARDSLHSVLLALSEDLREQTLEIGAHLERFGFQVETAASAAEVLLACGRERFDAVVFDLDFVEGMGMDTWLEKLNLISPSTAPLALGMVEELDRLRKTQRLRGDYSLLPVNHNELKTRLRRIVEGGSPSTTVSEPDGAAARGAIDRLGGRSVPMQKIRDRIRKVAALSSTVLITGESGVGKELIARALHGSSPRRDQPFIAMNCSALPESLLETELFGHEKGAFTGATGMVRGKFELAHRGTLFLDEIGDMNPITQAKFLRVLEEREFMRLGGSRVIRVDVRLVAATNADLDALMAERKFREDLYYRLKVLTIEVPPLRARADDVPELARAFIDRFTRENKIPPVRVTDEALARLQQYRWPGNIRELRNALENLIVSVPGNVIDVVDLPETMGARSRPAGDAPGGRAASAAALDAVAFATGSLEQMERRLIANVLAEVDGNRTRAARVLKIGLRTLQRKIKRYELD